MSKPVRVAVIGAGNMGRNHIRNYAALPQAKLIAIADNNPATKKLAQEYGVKFYTNYREMLEKEHLDAISVVVPTPLHHEVGSAVMKKGIHCLLEKPIASTVDEATKLIKLAKEKGVVFTVGHIEHYNPVIQKLKQLIDSNKIGTISSVVCKRVGGFPAVEPKTDVIIDLAVHDIGIINHLLGRYPKEVFSHGSRTLHTNKIDAAKILLDYGDASGFVQANWITPVKIRSIAVTGSKGYVEANYITQQLVHYEQNMKRIKDGFESFVKTLGEPKQHIIKVKFTEPLGVELRTFLGVIKGEHPLEHLVDPKAAKEALKIALHSVERYEVA